jgi:hypothetical protein
MEKNEMGRWRPEMKSQRRKAMSHDEKKKRIGVKRMDRME